jgi:hypothetical protein
MLLTPEDLGQSSNIDLTSPNGTVAAHEQIAKTVALAESLADYKLEQAQQRVCFVGGNARSLRKIYMPTAFRAESRDARPRYKSIRGNVKNSRNANLSTSHSWDRMSDHTWSRALDLPGFSH